MALHRREKRSNFKCKVLFESGFQQFREISATICNGRIFENSGKGFPVVLSWTQFHAGRKFRGVAVSDFFFHLIRIAVFGGTLIN